MSLISACRSSIDFSFNWSPGCLSPMEIFCLPNHIFDVPGAKGGFASAGQAAAYSKVRVEHHQHTLIARNSTPSELSAKSHIISFAHHVTIIRPR